MFSKPRRPKFPWVMKIITNDCENTLSTSDFNDWYNTQKRLHNRLADGDSEFINVGFTEDLPHWIRRELIQEVIFSVDREAARRCPDEAHQK